MNAFDDSSRKLIETAAVVLGNSAEAIEWIQRAYDVGRIDGKIEGNRDAIDIVQRARKLREAA